MTIEMKDFFFFFFFFFSSLFLVMVTQDGAWSSVDFFFLTPPPLTPPPPSYHSVCLWLMEINQWHKNIHYNLVNISSCWGLLIGLPETTSSIWSLFATCLSPASHLRSVSVTSNELQLCKIDPCNLKCYSPTLLASHSSTLLSFKPQPISHHRWYIRECLLVSTFRIVILRYAHLPKFSYNELQVTKVFCRIGICCQTTAGRWPHLDSAFVIFRLLPGEETVLIWLDQKETWLVKAGTESLAVVGQ